MALQPSELSVLHDDVDLDRDRVLVERCQSGDSSAFGELYSRYYARVYRFCFRRLHDHEEAEDVAQDAFARAWRALPTFAGERRFYPWLTVIADNRCRDIQRRRVRSTPTADVDIAAKQAAEPVSVDTPEDTLIASVEGDLAVQALGRLSARHRQVLALREGSGWTYQEIATPRGRRDQDGREPDLAGPPSPQARIRLHRQCEQRDRRHCPGPLGRPSSRRRLAGPTGAPARRGAEQHGRSTGRGHRRGPDVVRSGGGGHARHQPARARPGLGGSPGRGVRWPRPRPDRAVPVRSAPGAGQEATGGSYPEGRPRRPPRRPSRPPPTRPPPRPVHDGRRVTRTGDGRARWGRRSHDHPGQSPIPPGQIPSAANTVVPGSGASAVPPAPPVRGHHCCLPSRS